MSSRNNTGNSNEELIKHLKSRDVLTDPLVEDALRTIPRGDFIPDGFFFFDVFLEINSDLLIRIET